MQNFVEKDYRSSRQIAELPIGFFPPVEAWQSFRKQGIVMSSISGVGTSGLYQYYPTSQNSQTSATSANSIDGILTQGSTHAHGKHQHKGTSETNSLGTSTGATGSSSRIQQLQNAVVSALQSTQSNAGADPNQTVTNAIASIFKNNLNATSTSATDTDSDDTANSTSTTSTADTQESDFAQTLQDYGIDSQQFQQDFQNAVQQSQGGQVDPSQAFRSFPPGLIVDTTA
jgi:hypothetical protein